MPRSVGCHSDPTSNSVVAALEGKAAVADAARSKLIEDQAAAVVDCSSWLHRTLDGPIRPDHVDLARLQLEWHLTIPHSIATWRTDDEHFAAEVDHSIDLLATTAGKLRYELVEKVLRSSTKPKQQPIATCTNYARYEIRSDLEVGRYLKLCRRCGDFRARYRFLPNEAICRAWDRGSTRITPGMLAESKAASRRRRRRTG